MSEQITKSIKNGNKDHYETYCRNRFVKKKSIFSAVWSVWNFGSNGQIGQTI